MSIVKILNLEFIKIPGLACASTPFPFLEYFLALTLSLAGALAFMAAVWAAGLAYARARRLDHKTVHHFSNQCLHRSTLLLAMAYTPVVETVMAVFSCSEVEGAFYLREDSQEQCYTVRHMRCAAIDRYVNRAVPNAALCRCSVALYELVRS